MYAERTTLIQVLLPDTEFSTVFCQCCSMYVPRTLCVYKQFQFGLGRTGLFVFAGTSPMVQAPLPSPTVDLKPESPVAAGVSVDISAGESFSGLIVNQCALSQ